MTGLESRIRKLENDTPPAPGEPSPVVIYDPVTGVPTDTGHDRGEHRVVVFLPDNGRENIKRSEDIE